VGNFQKIKLLIIVNAIFGGEDEDYIYIILFLVPI
jgi:hypothetical protein